jgi:hypothetical protein
MKNIIETKTKHLTANWKINEVRNEVQDISAAFSEELAKEIDREIVNEIIMVSLIKDKGWTQPDIPYNKYSWPFDNRLAEISEWVHLNATGEYKNLNGKWVFELASDATMFTLKWA